MTGSATINARTSTSAAVVIRYSKDLGLIGFSHCAQLSKTREDWASIIFLKKAFALAMASELPIFANMDYSEC